MPLHRVYRAAMPFNASELADLDGVQIADTVYQAHPNHAPKKLIRYAHADWRIADVTFAPTIAAPTGLTGTAAVPNKDTANSGAAYFPEPATYVVTAYNEDTGQESRASLSVTKTNDLDLKRNYNDLSWTAVTGATGYRIYKSENTQAYGHIGTTTATTFRDNNIGPDLSEGPPVGDNPFAAAGDYPGCVTFHEGRSWWGRTTARPNAIFASRSADYENMDYSRPGREDDALAIGLVADKVNTVRRLVSFKQGLLAFTSSNIFSVQGSNEDYITAVPPPRVRPEIKRGASSLPPIGLDNITFYETAKGGEIRALGYQFDVDGVKSNDMTVFSRHLFTGFSLVSWCFVEKPLSALVTVRSDGKVPVLTFDEEQQVWGWTLWETDGNVKGVCSVTEGGEDRIYLLVERTIDGDTRLYVERMASALWEDQADACYLDCARTFTSDTPRRLFDHLEHLEGRTVTAWADAGEYPGLVVANGAVTLPVAASNVTIGLPFEALIETLPLAMQTGSGWNVARPSEAKKVVLRVVESRGIEYGVDEGDMFPVKMRGTEDLDEPTALFTGDLEVNMPGKVGNEVIAIIRSSGPTPLHLSAVMIEPGGGSM